MSRRPGPTVAVLGAGIMGSSVALFLARRGVRVVLIDAAEEPFACASRWNEGKIHLGFLYGADASLRTAQKLLPGGLRFPSLVAGLTGRRLDSEVVTQHDDRYLIHRDSVVGPEEALAVADGVARLCREHPDADEYFVPLADCRPRPLPQSVLEQQYDTQNIVAGFEVPERSVQTRRVADDFCEALRGCDGIELVLRQRVVRVRSSQGGRQRWSVDTVDAAGEAASLGPYAAVVNALWEGRGEVDATLGLEGPPTWTHRYRVSLFAKTSRPVDLRSAVVAIGPFGDVKNYDGRNLYISWYETGLLAAGHDQAPPPVPPLEDPDLERIAREKIQKLGVLIPGLRDLWPTVESWCVRGGWVYAAGHGELSQRESGLHRRDRVGSRSRQGYFSVDTGKYSIAPWLASRLADAVEAVARSG